MITNDKGIVELKHHILREVCRLAWDDRLTADNCERLVLEVIPGPQPQYRCCVYKEREIVRGRVRLAMGLNPDVGSGSRNVVAVIPAACDDCPIQDYMITDICRFCLGKACLNACRFGAVMPGDTRMHIDPAKCKSCGMCAKACPYGAIVHMERPCRKACPVGAITYSESGLCVIDDEKCVHCGHCIHSCPFGAIGSRIFAVDIFREAVDNMVDHACDAATEEAIRKCAAEQEGVLQVDILRTRVFGRKIYVDLEISADGNLTLYAAHDIAERVHDTIEKTFPEVKHIMVHVNPASAPVQRGL